MVWCQPAGSGETLAGVVPAYGQCVSAPLSFLMQSVLVSVIQGVLQPLPHVLGFSWCLIHE